MATVYDGDTFDLVLGRDHVRVRIMGIDAPERGQPFSQRAREALRARVLHREVRVIEVDRDRYGRTVGEVYAANVCVGCELVREGLAWVYRRYTDDPVLLALEGEARKARRGVWSLPARQRVAPWEYREVQRQEH